MTTDSRPSPGGLRFHCCPHYPSMLHCRSSHHLSTRPRSEKLLCQERKGATVKNLLNSSENGDLGTTPQGDWQERQISGPSGGPMRSLQPLSHKPSSSGY